VTRARYATVVVTSIRAEQIDLNRTKARGAMLMRSYLDFASRGIDAIKAAVSETPDAEHDSEFEAEVERALSAQGFNVRRQIGCGGFRIDLAIVHPERPGRFVLGIECDGATYHSSATARDRDRLRQEVLEGLGWRICRVWSTDWIRSPDRQIERITTAYGEEVARSDEVVDSNGDSQSGKSADQSQDEERPVLRVRRADDETVGRTYANIDAVSDRVSAYGILFCKPNLISPYRGFTKCWRSATQREATCPYQADYPQKSCRPLC
jgi:very-short-patch-repair endonuclease